MRSESLRLVTRIQRIHVGGVQAFAQVPNIHVYYGPDTYMGRNLAYLLTTLSTCSDEEVFACTCACVNISCVRECIAGPPFLYMWECRCRNYESRTHVRSEVRVCTTGPSPLFRVIVAPISHRPDGMSKCYLEMLGLL